LFDSRWSIATYEVIQLKGQCNEKRQYCTSCSTSGGRLPPAKNS
jgi:hypothetical protein